MDSSAAALSAQDRVGLVNSPKMQELAGPKVRARVEALRVIQSEHDELQAKFLQERAALEARYQKLYEPFYTKRFEIVNGIVEVEGGTNSSMEEGVDKLHAGKGVPDFWLMAMKTNEILAEEISEHDEEALRSLKDIKWCRIDNPKGFKLDFFFDDNPYFKNSVLTKTYHMIDDDDDEPILEKAIGTEVEWYPGKCLTQKVLKKKPKKGSKISKPMVKTEKCESFFNFFSPPDVPESEDDIDEDEAEGLQDLMEQDYEIACAIRDKIIPHAVSWFTGEAGDDLHFDDFEDEDGDDDDEEEEDEDEDDESEDEDEEEVKSSKKKGGRAQTGEGQQGERPPECNQQ